MFCPQCGVQTEQQTKFCKSCGLKLAEHVQLLATSREAEPERLTHLEAQRQLRWLKGTKGLLMTAVLTPLLMIFTGIAGSESHGPDAEAFGVTAFFFSLLWLSVGGRGFYHLLRGGFFQTYKQRRIRAEAALLNRSATPASAPPTREIVGAPFTKLPVDTDRYPSHPVAGVTEHTTRELQAAVRDSGGIS